MLQQQNDQREVTVALKADTKKYSESLKKANEETNKLTKGLSALTEKTDGLIKKTGKGLILLGSGQLAAMTAMSTVAATLEKQMSDIAVQSKLVGDEMNSDKIRNSIKDLSTQVPLARHEIVALASSITDMGVTSTRHINELTKSFVNLGAATGSNPQQVGAQMIRLQRQMGTFSPNVKVTDSMNDSLAMLTAKGGTPAESILEFSSQIAPSARVAGMSQQSVMGLATAFTRSDEDGRYAVSMLNSLNNDITMMKQTNSPELTRYAAALGVGVDELKKMSPEAIFGQLLTTIRSQSGSQGLGTLNQLGLGDNPRAVKAIQNVAGSGELARMLGIANDTENNKGASKTGAKEAFDGFFDSMERMRNSFTNFADNIGQEILPALTHLVDAFNSLLGAIKPITDLATKLLGWATSTGGMAMIGAGAIMKAWAATSTPAIIKRGISGTGVQAWRYGLMYGSREAGGYDPIANPNAQQIHDQMNPDHPRSFGVINRRLYGFAQNVGARVPYDPDAVPLGRRIVNTPFGIFGYGARKLMDWTRQHYNVSTLSGGNERIGEKQYDADGNYTGRSQPMKRMGLFQSFAAGFKGGITGFTGVDTSTPKNDQKIERIKTPGDLLKEQIKKSTETILKPFKAVANKYTAMLDEAKSNQKQAHDRIRLALDNLWRTFEAYTVKFASLVSPEFAAGVQKAFDDPELAMQAYEDQKEELKRKAKDELTRKSDEAVTRVTGVLQEEDEKLKQHPLFRTPEAKPSEGEAQTEGKKKFAEEQEQRTRKRVDPTLPLSSQPPPDPNTRAGHVDPRTVYVPPIKPDNMPLSQFLAGRILGMADPSGAEFTTESGVKVEKTGEGGGQGHVVGSVPTATPTDPAAPKPGSTPANTQNPGGFNLAPNRSTGAAPLSDDERHSASRNVYPTEQVKQAATDAAKAAADAKAGPQVPKPNPNAPVTLQQRIEEELKGKKLDEYDANRKAVDAQTKSIWNGIRAKAREILQSAEQTKTGKFLTVETVKLAKSFTMLAGAAARAGMTMAGQGVGAAVEGISSIMGLMGGLPGLGLMGGMAAYGIWQKEKETSEELKTLHEEQLKTGANGLRQYNEKLGLATDSLTSFKDSLDKLSKPSTVEQAFTDKKVAQAGRTQSEYTNSSMEYMTEEQAVSYIKGLGPLSADQATEIAKDLEKRFGHAKATEIKNQYLAETEGGLSVKGGPNAIDIDYTQSGKSLQELSDQAEKNRTWYSPGELLPGWEVENLGTWDSPGGVPKDSAWLALKTAENSPVKAIADTQMEQYKAQIDYVSDHQTSGDATLDAKIMSQAEVGNALEMGVKNLGENVRNIENENGKRLASAVAEQNIEATLSDMGLSQSEIDKIIEELDIRGRYQEYAEMSDEELGQYLWDTAYSKTEQGKILQQNGVGWQDAMSNAAMVPDQATSTSARTSSEEMSKVSEGAGALGVRWANDKVIQEAVMDKLSADPESNQKAMNRLVKASEDTSRNTSDQIAQLRVLGEKSPQSKMLVDNTIADLQAQQSRQLIGVNQETLIGVGNEKLEAAIENFDPTSEASIGELKGAKDEQLTTMRQMHAKWRDYWRQMDYEEEDYNRNRRRQTSDYNRQRIHDEEDYQRQLKHIKADYRLQIEYAEKDFERQQRWSRADFNRGMRREEKEHQIQIARMKENTAFSTNPTSRIFAQPTMSARTATTNIREHTKRLQQAKKDIAKLRRMGLSVDAIDMMNLSDPNQQQELRRLAATASVEEIQDLSSSAKKYMAEVKDSYMTDPEYNRGLRQAEQDRKRGIRNQVKDFERGANRSGKLFVESMERSEKAQAKSLRRMNNEREIQLKRMEDGWKRSLRRTDKEREIALARSLKDMIGWAEDVVKSNKQIAKELDGFLARTGDAAVEATRTKIATILDLVKAANQEIASIGKDEEGYKPKDGKLIDKDKDGIPDYIDKDAGDGTGVWVRDQTRGTMKGVGPDSGMGSSEDYTDPVNAYESQKKGKPKVYSDNTRGRPRHAMGGIARGAINYGYDDGIVGEAGHEAIIPLNRYGMEFLLTAIDKALSARQGEGDMRQRLRRHWDDSKSAPVRGKNMSYGSASDAMQVYNNNQTYFNGAITVVSEDPDEMARKLKHKQRLVQLRSGQRV